MKFAKKYLAIALVLALIIIAVALSQTGEETAIEDGNIRIYVDDEQIAIISYDEIMELKSYRRQVAVHSTTGDFVGDFRGALLSSVLDCAVEHWSDSYSAAKIIGSDGYYTELTRDEVLAENNAFIMYSDSEEPLMSLDNKSQSGRLVVIGDDFGQRFTNYVNEIYLIK